MAESEERAEQARSVVAAVDLAEALEDDRFRHFLDRLPIAIVIAELKDGERMIYANPQFEALCGRAADDIEGQPWSALHGRSVGEGDDRALGAVVVDGEDFVGTFHIERHDGTSAAVDAYSNLIEDDHGRPAFRLVALVDVTAHEKALRADLEERIRETDTLLREVQHRVKNNLQMVTALIRIEARNALGTEASAPFDRLAGRIESVQLLYQLLSDGKDTDEIDLGVYLGQIASAVVSAHAVEGVRLDLKLDTYPVSVNVAMPAGLVVNELLTNSLKHAFRGRAGGTISLRSLTDGDSCRVVVADDGVGLPLDTQWPGPGKLSALIVRSLRENAKAGFEVSSSPGEGVQVAITFTRDAAAPEAKV